MNYVLNLQASDEDRLNDTLGSSFSVIFCGTSSISITHC